MLHLSVPIFSELSSETWWRRVRLRLTIFYLVIAFVLLFISATGHARLLNEVGKTFGGFFWAIDTDKQVVVVSAPPQFDTSVSSLTNNDHIIKVQVTTSNNKQTSYKGLSALQDAYQKASPGDEITYSVADNKSHTRLVSLPAQTFTFDLWWQNYGLGLIAGLSWLLVGIILLATAKEWTGAVEGITLLPLAMLFLLYSHWGNVQQAYPVDAVFQLLWVPSFALLGAAFIHLSLTYRPQTISKPRLPRFAVDALPYLPLIALVAYELGSYFIRSSVPTRANFILSLSYAGIGGFISFCIGITSLLRVFGLIAGERIPAHVRHRLVDLLTLWIGAIGLGFMLGILPILLLGKTLLPLQIFLVLATVYPFLLLYAIRSLRLIDTLQLTLEQREEALREQQKTAEELRQANTELKKATSLLLHADAHLRSLLSQRIHDQPKQQALRIRSLLRHWQQKLKVESESDPSHMVYIPPVVEALGKVRKISEELESDLRGLQLLVEDVYQRRSLGLKLHLEKLIREDLPALHPESQLRIQPDLRALDAFGSDLEQTEEGEKMAEAISYTITQALLNVYNHAAASFATVRTMRTNGDIVVYIIDDGRGFDTNAIPPEKTSLFKAQLKAREAGGTLTISSILRPQAQHGTTVILTLPLPKMEKASYPSSLPGSMVPGM